MARGDLSRLSELGGIDSRLSGLESSHTNLLLEISRLQSSFETAVILDTASPSRPLDALPLSQALVFGVLGGAGLAVLLSVVIEHLADVVRTPSDAVNPTGIPLLGRLRHARRRVWPLAFSRRRRPHRALVMADARTSPVAEAIRSLRVALQLIAPPWGLQTLVVTSGAQSEGKTFVAGNLAIAQAQARRVVLVDGNLRRPSVHRWFGLSNASGFSDALALARNGGRTNDGEIAGVTRVASTTSGSCPRGHSWALERAPRHSIDRQGAPAARAQLGLGDRGHFARRSAGRHAFAGARGARQPGRVRATPAEPRYARPWQHSTAFRSRCSA